jgi:hypothetical protein
MNDSCYSNTPAVRIFFGNVSDTYESFGIQNNCAGVTSVSWVEPVTLVLGDVEKGEVVITDNSVFVDSVARPDLDAPAVLIFKNVPFAMEPVVERDGTECGDCNVSYDVDRNVMTVEVPGFSNYSLTGRQDFIVYSDTVPELDSKVYQTIDLGDANRGEEFACVVQLFARSAEDPSKWILVQTNPQRQVQAKLFGSPDVQQPESLGYFPTRGGIANVYFRDENIVGYVDFEYVAQCSSNSTKLVYEEPIVTKYHPAGRSLVGRGLWLTDGNNAFYLVIAIVMGIIVLLLVVKAARSWL